MKYPGTIPDPALEDWFANAAKNSGYAPVIEGTGKINPCLKLYGAAAEGLLCKNCKFFVRIQKGKVYFKCQLRNITSGAATDHRANWPACGKFERAKIEKVVDS